MFEQGLTAYLAANAGVLAQLGASRSDKTDGIFPQIAPDRPTYPYITYTQITGEPAESLLAMNRFTTARYRFSCTGSSYGSAKKLAEAFRQAFASTSQYQGTLSDGTVLQNARQVLPGAVDDMEEIPHGRIFTSHLDFEFQYANES